MKYREHILVYPGGHKIKKDIVPSLGTEIGLDSPFLRKCLPGSEQIHLYDSQSVLKHTSFNLYTQR